ncbi:MAG: tetratricopeptide repeat protein, partial [Deltaproteobacteria bacterium]|nr:tetratricopeptide repeat protein [Deltaproteobacteria bacterium]
MRGRPQKQGHAGLFRVLALVGVFGWLSLLSGCFSGGGSSSPTSGGMVSKENRLAAHLKMGAAFLEVGNYNAALAELSKADQLEPNNVEVNGYLGMAYFHRGDIPEAIARYQKVLALDPKRTETHNNLGLIYLRQRDFAQARAEFELCLNDPTYSQVHLAQFNLGLLEESQGHIDQAEAIYHKVINSNQMPAAYYRLGQLSLQKRDPRKAADYLLAAVRLNPRYADAYFSLAVAYEELGLKDEAAEA